MRFYCVSRGNNIGSWVRTTHTKNGGSGSSIFFSLHFFSILFVWCYQRKECRIIFHNYKYKLHSKRLASLALHWYQFFLWLKCRFFKLILLSFVGLVTLMSWRWYVFVCLCMSDNAVECIVCIGVLRAQLQKQTVFVMWTADTHYYDTRPKQKVNTLHWGALYRYIIIYQFYCCCQLSKDAQFFVQIFFAFCKQKH